MKSIEVALFSGLIKYVETDKNTFVILIKDDAKVKDVVKTLNIPDDKVLNTFVNGTRVYNDYNLSNNDRLAIFPLVAGG